ETARPKTVTPQEKHAILALGDDLAAVWDAPTTTDKDRKQLLRTLLDEVNITLRRDDPGPHAALVLRWKGGAISELTVPLRRRQPAIRTDEDTIDLIRRLAVHYPDAVIAGILNRQRRRTAAHPAHRSATRHAHRHRPRRLGSPRLRHPGTRRLPPDRIAEGQARRAARRPDPHRTQERPAYRATRPATRPVLSRTISKG